MSEHAHDAPDRGRDAARRGAVRALAGILFLQSVALAGATVFLVVELVTVPADSTVSAIALLVVTAIATVSLAAIAVNTLRGRSWIRGATVTVQVLVIAVAVGAFQGVFARPDIGWLLLIPAIAALALLFSRPVVEATGRRE